MLWNHQPQSLESAWNGKQVVEGWAETDIFIYPGYQFNVVDALLTNFHLPKSTLMMLVSALQGRKEYLMLNEAIREGYRFFSYGDAMFLGKIYVRHNFEEGMARRGEQHPHGRCKHLCLQPGGTYGTVKLSPQIDCSLWYANVAVILFISPCDRVTKRSVSWVGC